MTSRGSPPHISHVVPAHGHRLCPPGASLHRQSAHASLHQQPAPAAIPQLISPGPLLAGHSSLNPSSAPAHLPVTVPVPLLFFRAFPRHRADLFSPFIPFFRSCASVQSGLNWLRGLPCVLFCQLMSLAMRPVARRVCRWVGRIVPVMGGLGLQGL